MKYIILLFSFLLTTLSCFSQTNNEFWYSEKEDICLKFDSINSFVSINETFDESELWRMKYKRKKDKLKITWYSGQWLFGWYKDKYWLLINRNSKEELTLTLLPNKHGMLDEIWGGTKAVNFKLTESKCPASK